MQIICGSYVGYVDCVHRQNSVEHTSVGLALTHPNTCKCSNVTIVTQQELWNSV